MSPPIFEISRPPRRQPGEYAALLAVGHVAPGGDLGAAAEAADAFVALRVEHADVDAGRLYRHRSRPQTRRSEEHTSELQSLMRISYAVFCLKKKKTNNIS